jgi:hypothetical protein
LKIWGSELDCERHAKKTCEEEQKHFQKKKTPDESRSRNGSDHTCREKGYAVEEARSYSQATITIKSRLSLISVKPFKSSTQKGV